MTGVVIDVTAKTSKAERDLGRIDDSVKNIERTTSNAAKTVNGLVKAFAGFAATAGIFTAVSKISSDFAEMENKIAVVTGRTRELNEVQKESLAISIRTKTALTGVINTYGVLGRSLYGQNIAQRKILKVTEAIQKSITLSGAASESANSAIVQMGQGLSSGQLRGQELLAVLEQLPRVARAISDGMGVAYGSLKDLAEEGKLTTLTVFNALRSQAGKIGEEFANVVPTLRQNNAVLLDSTKLMLFSFDKGLNLSVALSRGVAKIADKMREASESAFDFGIDMNISLQRFNQTFIGILKPLGSILLTLGKQFLAVIPRGYLTRTLKGDLRGAIRSLDDFFGGWYSRWRRFKFIDVIAIESDVEIAVRNLKRLSPRYWAASGFDVQTIQKVFSTKNLRQYAAGLRDLAKAVVANSGSIASFLISTDVVLYTFAQKSARYFGLIGDGLIGFVPGQLFTLGESLIELLRGISGTSRKFYEAGGLLLDTLAPGLFQVFSAMRDAFMTLPLAFNMASSALGIFAEIVRDALGQLKVFLDPLWTTAFAVEGAVAVIGTALSKPFKVSLFEKVIGAFTGKKSALEQISDFISTFVTKIERSFFWLYDKVVGNSWWPDLINGVIDFSKKLLVDTVAIFATFKTLVSSTFIALLDVLTDIHPTLGVVVVAFATLSLVASSVYVSFVAIGYVISNFVAQLSLAVLAGATITPVLLSIAQNLVILSGAFATALLVDSLTVALKGIQKFAEGAEKAFFWLYDKVIGNSWWTDLVDSVVNGSSTLWAKSKAGLLKFRRGAEQVFKSLYEQGAGALNGSAFTLQNPFESSKFSISNLIDATELGDVVSEAFVKASVTLKTLLAATVVANVGQFTKLFQAKSIPQAFGKVLLHTLLGVASQFIERLTGKEIEGSLGSIIGEALGLLAGAILRSLPDLAKGFAAAASSFTRSFLESIPVIGTAIAGIFAIGDATGTSGALGLLGAYFFGPSVLNLLKHLGVFPGYIEEIQTLAGKVASSFGKKGVIGSVLFGKGATLQIIAALGSVLAYLGVFDGVLEKGSFFEFAVKGGLMYFALFGAGGIPRIISGIKKVGSVFVSLFAKLAPGIASSKTFDKIFSLEGFSKASLFKGLGDLVKAFSTDMNQQLDHAIDTGVKSFAKFYKYVRNLAIGASTSMEVGFAKSAAGFQRAFSGDFFSTKFAAISTAVTKLYGDILAASFAFQYKLDQKGGIQGVLKKFLFSKYGKFAVLGAVLFLFSSIVRAGEDTADQLGEVGVLDSFFSSFEKNFNSNPVGTVLETITVGWLALLFISKDTAFKVAGHAGSLLAAFGSYAVGVSRTVLLAMSPLRSLLPGLLGAAIGGTLGSQLGGEFGAAFGTIAGVVAASSFGKAFLASLLGVVRKIAVRVAAAVGIALSAVVSVPALLIAALVGVVTVGAGLLYTFLFGEKGTFLESVKKQLEAAKKLIFFWKKELQTDESTGLSKELAEFAKQEFKITWYIPEIDMDRAGKRVTNKIKRRLEQLEDRIGEAADQKANSGRVEASLRKEIETLKRGMESTLDAARSRQAFSTGEFKASMDDLFKRSSSIGGEIGQGFVDALIAERRFTTLLNPSATRGERKKARDALSEGRHVFGANVKPIGFDKLTAAVSEFESLELDIGSTFQKELSRGLIGYYRNAKDFDKLVNTPGQLPQDPFEIEDALEKVYRYEKVIRDAMSGGSAFAKRAAQIEAFDSRIAGLEANLSKLDLTLNTRDFALRPGDLGVLEGYGERASKLADEDIGTTGEANNNLANRKLLGREFNEFVQSLAYNDASAYNKVFHERMAKLLPVFSETTTAGFSKSFKAKLLKDLEELEGFKKSFNEEGNESFKTTTGSTGILSFLSNKGQAELDLVPEIENKRKALDDYVKKAAKIVEESVNSHFSADPLKELADTVGLSFDTLVGNVGLGEAKKQILSVSGALTRLSGAMYTNEPSFIEDALEDLRLAKLATTKVNYTAETLASTLSEIGISDTSLFDEAELTKLLAASKGLSSISHEMAALGKNADFAEVSKILKRQAAFQRTLSEAALKGLHSTPTKILESLSAAGIDEALYQYMDDGVVAGLLAARQEAEGIRLALQDENNVKNISQLVADLAEVESTFTSLSARRSKVEANRKSSVSAQNVDSLSNRELLGSIVEAYPALESLQKNLHKLSRPELISMFNRATNWAAKMETADLDGVSAAPVVSFIEQIKVLQKQLSKGPAPVVKNLQGRLSLHDIGFESETSDLFTEVNSAYLESLVTKADNARIAVEQAAGGPLARSARFTYNEILRQIAEHIETASRDPAEKARAAAETFADSVSSSVNEGFRSLLDGSGDVKDLITGVVDAFTSSVLDTFVDALLDPITGEDGWLTGQLKGLGQKFWGSVSGWLRGGSEGGSAVPGSETGIDPCLKGSATVVAKLGENSAKQGGFFGVLGGIFQSGMAILSGSFSNLFKGLYSIFTAGGGDGPSLLGLAVSIGKSVVGALGGLGNSAPDTSAGSSYVDYSTYAATGGLLRGPGTGTSDSINAKLSTGEFIVNAAQTAKHKDLLFAINSNRIDGYATGGMVGASVSSTTSLIKPSPAMASGRGDSTFHISITGDISRQTRSEIYKMLPQIAKGVNRNNHEAGR